MTREQRYGIRSLKRDFPDDNTVLEFMFDAPEDAVAKLAIELFKQGILK